MKFGSDGNTTLLIVNRPIYCNKFNVKEGGLPLANTKLDEFDPDSNVYAYVLYGVIIEPLYIIISCISNDIDVDELLTNDGVFNCNAIGICIDVNVVVVFAIASLKIIEPTNVV